jgi:hypothetical protein
MIYSRQVLSGSTDGKPIKVASTTIGSGTAVHTAASGVTGYDEVYLWASNADTTDHTLSLTVGGTTDPDNLFPKTMTIPAKSGPIQVWAGFMIRNSVAVTAFSDAANFINVMGFANRAA